MKICGLITEYNPFHNGHIHHMHEAREKTGADYLIVVMSGDFVQRGAPAIIDQYQRTKMALDGGADLVLQLPAPFSTSSAEIFSKAAVNLLHQLGCVDAIAFGAERGSAGDNGSVEDLKKIAEVLNSEPYEFKQDLREYIKTGFNYPTARAMALEDYFEGGIEDLQDLLEKPNNILAIEYLRALDKLRSSMKPYLIKRWKTDYHSEQLYQDVASATAIRKLLYQGKEIDAIAPYVTPMVRDIFDAEYGKSTPVRVNDFSAILQYRLESEKDRLDLYDDFAPELKDRVNKLLPRVFTYKEWIDALNSRSFTYSRIARALMHLVLNIREDDMKCFEEEDYCLYARILGFRKSASGLLTEIKNHSALPMISKMADAPKILTKEGERLLAIDVNASNLYRNIVYQKFGTLLKDDYTAGIIKR